MLWRVLNTGIADAVTNMAVDEAIMLEHAAGRVPPTLRFYGWRPAAVSLGYFQRAAAEIDLVACREQGIDIVRRLTGGRAVLHDTELTYSIVVSEGCPGISPTITASYRYFSEGLMAGLARLGVIARMNMPQAAYGQVKRQPNNSAACFDAPSHYEITVEGRKLIGSAQVRKHGVILQHGSVLLRFCPQILVSILRSPNMEARERLAQVLAVRAIGLDEVLGRNIDFEEICNHMLQGFNEALGCGLAYSQLTTDEWIAAKDLAAGKYSQDHWNYMR